MSERIYVGKGWKKTFDNGGHIINLNLDLDKLNELPVKEITTKNGTFRQISVSVASLRQAEEKSKADHTLYCQEWRKQEDDPF